jgi:hypothetical protein
MRENIRFLVFWTFYKLQQTGGAEALGELHNIVTEETCIPASLKASLGDIAVVLFLFVAGAVPILAYK